MLLIDNNFFSDLRLKHFTKQFSVVVFVRDIKDDKHLINDYFRLLMYFQSKINDKIIVAHFC